MIGVLLGVTVLMVVGSLLGPLIALIPFLLAWNFISPTFGLPYLGWLDALALLVVVFMVGSAFKSTVTK